MAGYWIPIDVCIHEKEEVIELALKCSLDPDIVVSRLIKLWGWYTIHSDDGAAKQTPESLELTLKITADFWRAVEGVGWLKFNKKTGLATLPEWEDRFSGLAKAKRKHAAQTAARRRHDAQAAGLCAQGSAQTAHKEFPGRSLRGEERKEEKNVSSSSSDFLEKGWPEFLAQWNQGSGKRWKNKTPPPKLLERAAEPGFIEAALRAIDRIPSLKFFDTPPTLSQFGSPGFVEKVNGGDFDSVNKSKRPVDSGGFNAPAPPKEFDTKAKEAVEYTKRKLELQKQIREAS